MNGPAWNPVRIVDVKPENRVKTVERQADGGMRVVFHSGAVVDLGPGDDLIQAFTVYSVLAEL
jgi:hypothetical protein